MSRLCSIITLAALMVGSALTAEETLLLQSPSVSDKHICFQYGGDIWIANRDGSAPRRLTQDLDQEIDPKFSPDGKWIAFTGRYGGNWDVFVVAAEGGTPKRLTWNPTADMAVGWTPDGSKVMFVSSRLSNAQPIGRLFLIGMDDAHAEPLPMPRGLDGSFSPDSSHVAYMPTSDPTRTWKRYRGGLMSRIWVFDLKTYDHVEIPGKTSNDIAPQWLGDKIYFLSDRNHIRNVFSYDVASKAIKQETFHKEYDVKSMSSGAGVLAYDQGGRLHIFDPKTGKTNALKIKINGEAPAVRPHYKDGKDFIVGGGVSSTGVRAAIETRGEIFTVPLENGSTRNITNTPGVHERYPAWSPNGGWVAYFTEHNGEYALALRDQKGVGEQRIIELPKKNFYYHPRWSPDSTKIAFTDKQLNVWYVDVEKGKPVKVDTESYDHFLRTMDPAWSPDSAWLTYSKRQANHMRAIFVYNLADKTHHQITDNASDAISPRFSRDGKHLYFALSTDVGLNVGWLDMSSFERPTNRTIYVAVLNKNDPSPFAAKSDEEAFNESEEKNSKKVEGDAEDSDLKVVIDFENLDQRILATPIPAGNISGLEMSEKHLFYLQASNTQFFTNPGLSLHRYDLKDHKSEEFMGGIQFYDVSADGKKVLYRAAGKTGIVDAAGKAKPGDGSLNLEDLKVYVDPRAEWRQIFNEVWRIERDFFYVENMHGLDWDATRKKYEKFLPYVTHRAELNDLIADLIGEMVVGHNYITGGDYYRSDSVPTGFLGADYEVANGRYRFKTIYKGQNWNPHLRAPLTEPGVNVAEGDYLLKVNGKEITAKQNLYRFFEHTVDKPTELTVNSKPDLDGARTVLVKPLGGETSLRHFSWVEGNRKKVDELSNGQLAYAYMANTSYEGYEGFNRGYFTNLKAKGLIIDERMNGGGFVADYVIQMLSRQTLFYWTTRQGDMISTPNAHIQGPQAMLIDQYAGSGGDAMPAMFKRAGLGKLVGVTTWGGLVGIFDYPQLMDGGGITAPRIGVVSPDGEYEIENVGVPPDVEVFQNPKAVIQGHDPQLEKAVEILLEELKNTKDPKPDRPKDPNRVK